MARDTVADPLVRLGLRPQAGVLVRRRDIVTIVILIAALWGMFFAGRASAAPLEDTTWAAHDRLEQLVGDLPERPFLLGDDAEMEACGGGPNEVTARTGCAGLAYPSWILIDRHTADWLEVEEPDALQIVVHEALHRPDDDSLLDEGIVDALAADVCPAVAWTLWRARGDCHFLGYPVQVSAVRRASARATGAGWRSRTARHWRKALWGMTLDQREAVYAAAWEKA